VIIDTSAIIAILRDEPDVIAYARAIADATIRRVSAVNFVETAVVIAARARRSLIGLLPKEAVQQYSNRANDRRDRSDVLTDYWNRPLSSLSIPQSELCLSRQFEMIC
jgi:uncharacterized protein with PIN domain